MRLVNRTQKIIEQRRDAKFVTPIPKPKKRKAASELCFRRRQWAFHKGTAIRSNIHEIEFNGISVDLRYRVQLLTSITLPSID